MNARIAIVSRSGDTYAANGLAFVQVARPTARPERRIQMRSGLTLMNLVCWAYAAFAAAGSI